MSKKPKLRRPGRALLVVAVVSMLFTVPLAAAGASTKAKKPLEGVTITYLYSTNGPDLHATKVLVQKFQNLTGAKVDLHVVPYANELTIAEADVTAGRPPAVMDTTSPDQFANDEVNLGKVLGPSWEKEISPSLIGPATYKGNVIALPNQLTVYGMFINTAMWKKAGVAVPTVKSHYTWTQFIADAVKVQKANGTPFALAIDHSAGRLSDIFCTFGYSLFGSNGKSAGNAADLTAAMKYFGGLFQQNIMPKDFWISAGTSYAAGDTLFLAKEAPALFSGSWELASFLTPSTAPSFPFAVVPSPCEKACGSMSGGAYMVAFKNSNNPKAAEEFIQFMTEPQNQAYMSVISDTIPSAAADAVPGAVKFTKSAAPSMEAFSEQAPLIPSECNISVNEAGFDAAGLVMEQQFTDVIAGTTTPTAATTATLAAAKANL